MKNLISLLILLTTTHLYAISINTKAPDFELISHTGKKINTKELRGKTLILEWYNYGCPFVRKHYDSNNMQQTQKLAIKDSNTIWLSIVSSAKGKQGYLTTLEEAEKKHKEEKSLAHFILLDKDGSVGRLYEAKRTPEIFIINKKGIIKYMGAIDSIPSADKSDIKRAKNYVNQALSQLSKGQKVSIGKTKAYGCSIKY